MSSSSRSDDVWAALEADPEFVAGMDRAREDFEAGRFTPYRHITERPDPLRPSETDQEPDFTDTAKQAAGWYLIALVLVLLGVIACAGSALYVWARS